MNSDRQKISEYLANQYAIYPEYLWQKFPKFAVFRHHSDNEQKGKWFALMGNISGHKLGLNSDEKIDFINLKCRPEMVAILLTEPNVLPAYHMNKTHWVSICLDKGYDFDELCRLVDWSYDLTKK